MASSTNGGRRFIALLSVTTGLSIVVALGLLVAAVLLFASGRPAGIAALVFGIFIAGLSVLNIWLVVRSRKIQANRLQTTDGLHGE